MMRTNSIKTIQDERGLTYTELLVTLVIVVLGSVIVAGGLPAATKAYESMVDASNAQSLLTSTTTILREELAMASDWSVTGTSVKYVSETTGEVCELTLHTESGGSGGNKKPNELYLNGTALGLSVMSEGTKANDLYLTCESFEKTGADVIQFNNIDVYKEGGDSAIAHIDEYAVMMLLPSAVVSP